MTGPERDPLAANEDRLGAIRALDSDVAITKLEDIEIRLSYYSRSATPGWYREDVRYLLKLVKSQAAELTQARGDMAALEEAVGRMGDNLTQDWIDMIDSSAPPDEPKALIWHQWCDQMLRDYAKLCKKIAHGDAAESEDGA